MKIKFPFPPMEARTEETLPQGPDWQFEPKWDGFRCIAFKENKKIELQSKAQKPLTRYFPELVTALEEIPEDFVLDGEIVIRSGLKFSFDDLLQRIHPAKSRIEKLSKETPADYIVFDILSLGKRSTAELPLNERRKLLETFSKKFRKVKTIFLSPAAKTFKEAKSWLKKSGDTLDGLMAKLKNSPYMSGQRQGMVKIKFKRSADCVVGGYRMASKGGLVGSLLLGLYDKKGLLNHVGFVSTSHFKDIADLTKKLKALNGAPGFTGSSPGGPSRWSSERSSEWQPVKPKLVVEVEYDHFSGNRFRHGTKFLRWRPDKDPKKCTFIQVEKEAGAALLLLRKNP
jgi:ATP-dependent DNA ligase